VLKKENNNVLDHKQKLQTIDFTTKTWQKEKENDLKRCQSVKQTKFQGRLDQMGVLHGELQKQAMASGGCIPNTETTPIPLVSRL
jgi:hypothetical protein